jgi:hypothetical protein
LGIFYRFIARIEEILSEWKLNGPEISNTEVREILLVMKYSFIEND